MILASVAQASHCPWLNTEGGSFHPPLVQQPLPMSLGWGSLGAHLAPPAAQHIALHDAALEG